MSGQTAQDPGLANKWAKLLRAAVLLLDVVALLPAVWLLGGGFGESPFGAKFRALFTLVQGVLWLLYTLNHMKRHVAACGVRRALLLGLWAVIVLDSLQDRESRKHFKVDLTLQTSSVLGTLLLLQWAASGRSRETSWQEFRAKLLGSGAVKHLLVVNGTLVRVALHRPYDVACAPPPQSPATPLSAAAAAPAETGAAAAAPPASAATATSAAADAEASASAGDSGGSSSAQLPVTAASDSGVGGGAAAPAAAAPGGSGGSSSSSSDQSPAVAKSMSNGTGDGAEGSGTVADAAVSGGNGGGSAEGSADASSGSAPSSDAVAIKDDAARAPPLPASRIGRLFNFIFKRPARGGAQAAEPQPQWQPPPPLSYYFTIGSVESFERRLDAAQFSLGVKESDFLPVQFVQEASRVATLRSWMPVLFWATVLGFFGFMGYSVATFGREAMAAMGGNSDGSGGGGFEESFNIFNIGRSNAQRVNSESVNVTFADVAGVDEAKKEVMEFVEFLKNPKRFTDLGASMPKGALLSGPPGTGKTLLARATAGEAGVPFYTVSGSDFSNMFVGVGADRVRNLFAKARADAPCIIYIDEIDAVGHRRTEGEGENTLNQLLVEMDGFNKSTSVVVLASTNRVDILDTALLRPGRFDRHIVLDLPDIKGRKQIFEVHLKKLKLAKRARAYSTRLAGLTPGFSGADIVNVVNEAAIVAARSGLSAVDMGCFERAADRVIGGLESGKVITPEERRVVAFHEAGHAVAGWFLEHAHPLVKVTIIPRSSGALGYSQYLPRESALRTRAQLLDVLATTLAGRASEQVNLGAVSTGARNDLAQVTRLAYDMVTAHGMAEEVGQVAFDPGHGAGGRGHYSDHTAHLIDVEVKRVVDEAYQRAVDTVTKYNDRVGALAELLLRSETATHDDLVAVLGARPFASHRAYEDFLTAALGAPDDDDDEEDDADGHEDARGVSAAFRWGALAGGPTCASRARARAPARSAEPEGAGSEAGQG